MPALYYAATCQTDFPSPLKREEIAERTRRMCAVAEQTIVGYEPFFDVRLLVFPEFAHSPPVYDNVKALRQKLAVELPNEHTEKYAKLCRQYGCYIQTGSFLETDPDFPGLVFNTTALIGPSGLLSKYRKVNTWIPWEVHTSPHDIADYGYPLTWTPGARPPRWIGGPWSTAPARWKTRPTWWPPTRARRWIITRRSVGPAAA
jgi:predicted amidohydrolase